MCERPLQGGQSLLSKSLRTLAQRISSLTSTSSQQDSSKSLSSQASTDTHRFASLEAVCRELQLVAGLESSNLLVAVDFTKSNAWTGEASFGGRCLHTVDPARLNPYEETLAALCSTLESFDDDNLYPCYGFGDATTKDKRVFSFWGSNLPCEGMQGVLSRYRQLAPHVRLAGPTSFAPAIREAMRMVVESGAQYHILLLVADGQITCGAEVGSVQPTPQEVATAQALVDASNLPLSVVVVGVGDGPWHHKTLCDQPEQRKARRFDNYHFVNATEVMRGARDDGLSAQEAAARLAMHALMAIPDQYRAIRRLGLLGADPSPAVQALVGQGPLEPPAVPETRTSLPTGSPAHSSALLSCPLTGHPMVDPVMAADGFVYERSAITRHLASVGPTSPLTAAALPHLQLLPCHTLRGSGELGPASPMTAYTGLSGVSRPGSMDGLHPPRPLALRDHSSGSGLSRGSALHESLRGSGAQGWEGSMSLHSGMAYHAGLAAMHGLDACMVAQSNTETSLPSMHSISSADSRTERPGGTPPRAIDRRGVGLGDALASLAHDLDRMSIEPRYMSRAHTTSSYTPSYTAAARAPLPPLTLPLRSPTSVVANPFAAAPPPPRTSHEGVLFLDDSVVVPQSAFEAADVESEGGSLPGLEGPRPAGAVRHRITRAGTTPPVALEDWDPVKPSSRPAKEGQAATEASASRAWEGDAENDSPFVGADGPEGAVLFPELSSGVQGLVEQPSWVDGRPSASALLSPFVRSSAQHLSTHRSSTDDVAD